MCTAVCYGNRFFGRTLDYERSYGESIVFAPKNSHSVATKEKRKAYTAHRTRAADASFLSFFPSARATSLIVARFMPEVAKVTEKPYIPESREYSPIASAPALFETYTLKLTPTVLIRIETAQRIIAFKKNFLMFFIVFILSSVHMAKKILYCKFYAQNCL